MKYSKEIIYHFTCEACDHWWSIALENELTNKDVSWHCPWCGHTHNKERDTSQNLSEQYTNKYQHKDAPYDFGHTTIDTDD